jgi:hypothetical protein
VWWDFTHPSTPDYGGLWWAVLTGVVMMTFVETLKTAQRAWATQARLYGQVVRRML